MAEALILTFLSVTTNLLHNFEHDPSVQSVSRIQQFSCHVWKFIGTTRLPLQEESSSFSRVGRIIAWLGVPSQFFYTLGNTIITRVCRHLW